MLKKLSLVMVIAFSGALAHATDTAPDRFLKVEDGVYRGAVVDTDATMSYLHSVGVKTIVDMVTDPTEHALEQQLANKYAINLVWTPVDGFWGPNDAQTKVIQQWLNDPSARPVYIHCTHGRDRTGVEVGLYRVWTDHWTAHAAYAEMKKLGFRNVLLPMTHYFKNVSGFEAEEDAGMHD